MKNTELSIQKGTLISMMENQGLDAVIKPLSQEIHLFDSYIAGTIHLKDKSVLEKIKIGDVLSLQRENNKFDSNAILVLNGEKKKYGFFVTIFLWFLIF